MVLGLLHLASQNSLPYPEDGMGNYSKTLAHLQGTAHVLRIIKDVKGASDYGLLPSSYIQPCKHKFPQITGGQTNI